MADDRDPVLDALFAGPPEEFVAGRDRLAAELRAAGDRARATTVKALRRPTVAAFALNRVALAHGPVVATFLDASGRLRQLQESGDDPGALRDAIAAQRVARRALIDATDTVLTAHGVAAASARDEIAATLDAAALDDALATAVRTGRLTRAGGSASAFSTLRPNPDVVVPPAAPRRGATPASPAEPEAPADTAPSSVTRATDAAERRRQARRDARILAVAARVDEAQRDLETAEEELAAAATALRTARKAVDDAQRAHDAALRTRDRARTAEERARAALDRI